MGAPAASCPRVTAMDDPAAELTRATRALDDGRRRPRPPPGPTPRGGRGESSTRRHDGRRPRPARRRSPSTTGQASDAPHAVDTARSAGYRAMLAAPAATSPSGSPTSTTCATGRSPAARPADAGHPRPAAPVRAGRRRPGPRRHRRPRPGPGARARHRAGRPDQPHRDPGPRAGPPGGRGVRRRHRSSPTAPRSPSTGHGRGHGRPRPRPSRPRPRTGGAARAALLAASAGPGRTADGHPVELLPNIGRHRRRPSPRTSTPRASGCSAPSCSSSTDAASRPVDEQVAAYAAVFAAFSGRKVVVRTLDAGADKPLPFLEPGPGDQPRARGAGAGGSASRNPGLIDASWRRSPRRPTATGARCG